MTDDRTVTDDGHGHPATRRRRSGSPLRRRTLQVRLAAGFGGVFLLVGLVLLAILYLFGRATALSTPVAVGTAVGIGPQRAVAVAQRAADAHQQLVVSAVALIILAAASVALGWAVAGTTLRPLRTITATAREISASNLHRRLAVEGPYEEFRELGATLDDLLSRLEASFASQRNFVANASHELRTPLTAERAVLQVAMADPDPSVASLRAACEELVALGSQQERLIDDLLTLAESERGIERWERFDLAGIARTVVHDRLDEAAGREVALDAAGGMAPVVGDKRLATILVGNLVDNAIRHNVPGGHATVRTSQSGRGSTVAVSNSGPLVSDEDVDHLFEPFVRLAGARRLHGEGHGLGLAIVRSVADVHRAELHARARPQGGLAVSVTFPYRELPRA